LFWFPWIYSTAELLLLIFPVRGVAQAIIAWWFSNNLLFVWLGLVGLAAMFYFIPKLTNSELHSRYLALLTFGF
jgi:cytochrome c oxidase cbb3-type subunit 1